MLFLELCLPMPHRAKHPCKHPACPALVESGTSYCDNHKAPLPDRLSPSLMGYGRRWQKRRALFLQVNPLCAQCQKEGVVKAADAVDHIIPHKGDMRLFWKESNWQSLCYQCHNSKTGKERRTHYSNKC